MNPSRSSRTYLALYFNLERREDLDLLTLLYALPVSQRGPAIKQVLRAALAPYLQTRHPDHPPLDRQAVRDLVATRARARRRRRRDEPAHGGGGAPISLPAPPSPEGVGPAGAASPASGEPAVDGHRPSAGDAELRLDRLLRSFQR
jgi:hypothetical protein